jgi:hypothetical protein
MTNRAFRIDSTGIHRLLADHLLSIRDVMNSSGSAIDHIDYDTFGFITNGVESRGICRRT